MELVRMIKTVEGIEHLGYDNKRCASDKLTQPLGDEGMDSLNISMDTLNPEKYKKITRIGDISYTLKGIEAARSSGFDKIKINMVVMDDTTDGIFKPCLHSNQEIHVNPEDISSSLKEAILEKPENGSVCTNRNMIEIGG